MAIVALAALALAVVLWEYLMSLYFLMVVTWLLVAAGLASTPLFRRLSRLDGVRMTMLVLGVAMAWRFLMLVTDQVLTNDIVSFVGRGQAYLHGAMPYTEGFSVNKPPAYLYLAAGMGASVGPTMVGTRAIMGLVDAVVALMVFWMGEERFSRPFGLMAGLLYAINPISAVAIGISGHYDPWVITFAMGGVWMLLRGRLAGASLLLGVGFALKLYPVVLLPWVLLAERTWPRRLGLAALFALPMALSWVPVLLQNPDALWFYLDYQGSWEPNGGIAFGLATAMGIDTASDAAGVLTRVVEWAFYALMAAMFLDWLRRRTDAPDAHLMDWFRVVTLGFAVLYGALLAGGAIEYQVDAGVGVEATAALVVVAYAALAATGLWWLWTRHLPGDQGFGPDDRLVMLSALTVNLLLLGSAQYNPWYLLWLLPLVLLVRHRGIRDAWTALLAWRAEGRGFTIWPEG
jgi:hypothetical protein